jgi:hypothetical protein
MRVTNGLDMPGFDVLENTRFDPTLMDPDTPIPPVTTTAPVTLLLLAVPELATRLAAAIMVVGTYPPVNVDPLLNTVPLLQKKPLAVMLPVLMLAKLVAVTLALVVPVAVVYAVTNDCVASDQYKATLLTRPLALLNKNPTSTLADADP